MKKTFKRILISVCLAVLVVITCGFCLVACNKSDELKITFKTQPYAYAKYDTAYVYDFIEKEDGVSYSFAYNYLTVSDSGETVSTTKQELEGNTIYLNAASRYTLYVTATKGEKSVSDSTTFDVADEAPLLLPVSVSLTYNVGSSALVRVLLDKASPIVIPLASEIVVDYYTFQENAAPTLTSSVNTNEKVKVDIDTTDEDARVTFAQGGLYEFHMVATNGGKTSDATFKVKVLPDQTIPVEGIEAYKNAEFGQNADGTTDASIVRLVGQPDIENASYVVLEDNFVNGQVARFEFYGQNIPQFSIFAQNLEGDADPYGMTSGLGYFLTTQRSGMTNALSFYGFARMNASKTVRLRYTTNKSNLLQHFGWDSLEEGKHYCFEFQMKTIGGTGTKAKENSKALGCGGVDWLIERCCGTMDANGNYSYPNLLKIGLFYSLYEIDENNNYNIIAHSLAASFETSVGLSRDAFGSFFATEDQIAGKLIAYSSITKDITFKYYKDTLLNNTTFNKNDFTYDEETHVISWAAVEGATNYVISTNESTSNRIAVVDATTTSYDLTEVYNNLDPFVPTTIQIHASTGNNKFSNCVYEQELLRCDDAWGNTSVSGELIGYDADESLLSVKLSGGYFQSVSSARTNQSTNTGYVAFGNAASADDKYTLDANGTYVDFYFTGNNMPNVEFFGSSVSGDMWKDGTNTGYVVSNGHTAQIIYRNYPQIKAAGLINKDLANTYTKGATDNILSFAASSWVYNGLVNFTDYFKFGVSNYNKFNVGKTLSVNETTNAYKTSTAYAAVDETEEVKCAYWNGTSWTTDTKIMGSKFSMYSLMQDETQKWHYVVGMYLVGNDVYLDAKLYKVDAEGNDVDVDTTTADVVDAYASYNAKVETLDEGVVRSGYIVAHAAIKGLPGNSDAAYKEYTYTALTCTKPYAGDASARA